ncbi:hypothetical protein H8D57_04105 [bacterium]|nr:hypothetical protein [bacterium]
MEPKQYISKRSRKIALIYPTSLLAFGLFLFSNHFYVNDVKMLFDGKVSFQLFMGLYFIVDGIVRLNSVVRIKAAFENNVWTFHPAECDKKEKRRSKTISFMMEDLVEIDLPKFSKQEENPNLLITFYDNGREIAATVGKKYPNKTTRELLKDLMANYPDKLSMDAKENLDYWKNKS